MSRSFRHFDLTLTQREQRATHAHHVVRVHAGGPQVHHYNECLRKFGSRHRYMAFIDNDEVRRDTSSQNQRRAWCLLMAC